MFLAYARADSAIVERLRTDLQTQGIITWIDREGIQPGTPDWEEALLTAIRGAHAVLLVASPNARSSRYVKDELRIAQMYQRPICPVWVTGTQWLEAVPLGMGRLQYIDAREKHYEEALNAIITLLRRILETSSNIPVVSSFSPAPVHKAISPRRLRIFLCHSSGDKLIVRKLYRRLKACNLDPWLDEENLLPGQNWEHEIRKSVRDSDVVIVCLSSVSISKTGFVQKEIKFALDVADEQPEGTIFLIPLKLEECGIPERLRHLHTVNYFEEDSFDKLLSALKHRGESLKIDLVPINCQPNIETNTLNSPQTEEFALLRTLKGHSGAIWSVAISPNGQLLASGSQDTTLKIWNLHTGELLHNLKGYSGTVYRIAISPDGQTIVSGNSDGTIKIWNLETGELLHTLGEHSHFINSLAVSPDGQTIATGSGDNTIKVWNLQAGQLHYTLSEPVNSLAINPNGKILASGDGTIKIWNLETGELLRTLPGHSRHVNSIAISLDGQIIVTGSSDRTIKVWNLQSGKLLRTIRGHTSSVIDIVINSDEQTLASVSYDNSIKVWNLHTGVLLHTLIGHSDNVFRIAFSSDGQLLASGSKDTTIKIWRRNKLVVSPV